MLGEWEVADHEAMDAPLAVGVVAPECHRAPALVDQRSVRQALGLIEPAVFEGQFAEDEELRAVQLVVGDGAELVATHEEGEDGVAPDDVVHP